MALELGQGRGQKSSKVCATKGHYCPGRTSSATPEQSWGHWGLSDALGFPLSAKEPRPPSSRLGNAREESDPLPPPQTAPAAFSHPRVILPVPQTLGTAARACGHQHTPTRCCTTPGAREALGLGTCRSSSFTPTRGRTSQPASPTGRGSGHFPAVARRRFVSPSPRSLLRTILSATAPLPRVLPTPAPCPPVSAASVAHPAAAATQAGATRATTPLVPARGVRSGGSECASRRRESANDPTCTFERTRPARGVPDGPAPSPESEDPAQPQRGGGKGSDAPRTGNKVK